MAARKSKKKNPSINVDFSDTGSRVSKGDHIVTVETVTVETSSNSGADYLKWVLTTEKGGKLWYNTSLQPHALFSLRNVLEALGMEVPSGAIDLDISELVGLEMGVTVEMENYQGTPRPQIVAVMTLEEMGDEAEEDEEDESEEEAEEEEAEDEDEDEDEEEEEEPPKKKGAKKKAPAKSKKSKPLKKKSKVSFDDEGETLEGVVTDIDGEVVTVEVDGEEWELEKDDLTVI